MSSRILASQQRNFTDTKGKRSSLQKFFIVLILLLLLILLIEILFHFVVSPALVINRINIINPGIDIERDEFLKWMEYDGTWTYFSVNEAEIGDRIKRIPAIRDVQVVKVFPDTLKIRVATRKALGISVVTIDGGDSVPVSFDESGTIFAVGNDLQQVDLPVISGLNYPAVAPGMKLPEELIGFLSSLKTLSEASPRLAETISEIKIVKKEYGSFECMLFPVHEKVCIRLGTELNETILTHIIIVLDIVKSLGTADMYEEIDFRTGEPVYRLREEKSAR